MDTLVKITAFAAALAASFGAAYGVGLLAGPQAGVVGSPAHPGGPASGTHRPGVGPTASRTGGLGLTEDGYTLALRTSRMTADRPGTLRFAVHDGSGRRVTGFRREHGREMHLILASRDLSTYRHLHPTRDSDGTWSTPVELPEAGDYRVFADFTPAGKRTRNVTPGADLAVAGPYRPATLPGPARSATVDGYTVSLGGTLRPGRAERVTFTVRRDGRPVTALQPYLGAYGHLVALRAGDLAYLHVHAEGAGPGPDVSFTTTAPGAATYRLFLDFKHDGVVRTAAFTVTSEPAEGIPRPAAPSDPVPLGPGDEGHGH
ncbi:hypothetical protein OHT61_24890 [Streptomyces sp. NBC_00178]|uniref:hypothetical protein n=1 Tax=Streptomyces sp. NBC_00178 TaxID=2975672 RepID=UPI002E2E2CE0|nr:hypothetical protein [Streptomyces sp. NBC_00178]